MVRIYVFGFVLLLSGSVDCLCSSLLNDGNHVINTTIGTTGVVPQIKPTIVVTPSFAQAIEDAANAYSLFAYRGDSDHPLLSYDVQVVKQERDLSCFSPKCRSRSYLEVVTVPVAISSRAPASENLIGTGASRRSRKGK